MAQGVEYSATARGKVFVDGACGVGALKVAPLNAALAGAVELDVRNGVDDGKLNHLVGAEHAQKSRTPPKGFDAAGDTCDRGVRNAVRQLSILTHHNAPRPYQLTSCAAWLPLMVTLIAWCTTTTMPPATGTSLMATRLPPCAASSLPSSCRRQA